MATYATVTMGAFSFLDHSNPKYNDIGAPSQLDNVFSETFDEDRWNALFTDDTRDDVRDDVVDRLRAELVDIITNTARGDHARIAPSPSR